MKLVIETIPHDQHRYETVGDYWRDPDGTIQIRVSDMGNWNYEFLVALHELVELVLVEARGIPFSAIDAFDKKFESERAAGKHGTDEPGDDPRAPYRDEHCMATGIERAICAALRIDWKKYEEAINAL